MHFGVMERFVRCRESGAGGKVEIRLDEKRKRIGQQSVTSLLGVKD
jgi:hypothetical protein